MIDIYFFFIVLDNLICEKYYVSKFKTKDQNCLICSYSDTSIMIMDEL